VNKVVLGQDIYRVLRFYVISTFYQWPMLFLHVQAAGHKDKLTKPLSEIRNMQKVLFFVFVQKSAIFCVCSQNFNGRCIESMFLRRMLSRCDLLYDILLDCD
jgi:hypothetical protein